MTPGLLVKKEQFSPPGARNPGVITENADYWAVMSEWHDLAMSRHWSWSHGQGTAWDTYVRRKAYILALWMPPAGLDQIATLPEGKTWTDIPDAVLSCRNACKTGEALFEFCNVEVQFGLYCKRVDGLVDQLFETGFQDVAACQVLREAQTGSLRTFDSFFSPGPLTVGFPGATERSG